MRSYQAIWVIIGIALLLRVWTLGVPFTGDENPWPYAAKDHSSAGFNFIIDRDHDSFVWTSPPLAPLAYRFFTWPFGVNEASMRLVPLIIGLVNIFLTFLLARRLFEPKTAVFSAGIMAVSFWHVLSSFLIEHDSSFLALFWLLFFLSYSEYESRQETKWLITAGIVLGLALLTKLTGGLMLIVLGAYLLWQKKELKQPVIECTKILGMGLAVFSAFPILSLLLNPAYFWETIMHAGVLTLIPSLFSPVRIMIYLLLWATPLLAGLALLSLFEPDKRSRLLWCWSGIVVLFYVFTKYMGAIDRYMAVMIPALAILAGRELAKRVDWQDVKRIIVFALPILGLLLLANLVPSVWLEHNVAEYLRRALTLKWGFVFPFHGGGGPAFMTSFVPLGIGLLASIGSFGWLVYCWLNDDEKQKTVFVVFASIALAFNLFLVQALILGAPYPRVGDVTKTMAEEIVADNLPKPYYVTDMNLAWYLKPGRDVYVIGDVYTDTQEEVERIEGIIKNRGGTVVITDFPKRLKTDNAWQIAGLCSLHKTFGSREMILGYVFVCTT